MTSLFEILIKPNVNGTYSVNNFYLDTYESEPITFDYSIADIKDISTRNSSRSLTITVPETSNNRYVFQQISDLGVNSTFNPNLNSPCVVLVDSVTVLEGYLCLTGINYDYNSNFTEYNCTIIADNGNFWVQVGEGFLQDLDLSRYDHRWTYQNIVGSWTTNGLTNSLTQSITPTPIPQSYNHGYFYPLIDYDNGWTLPFIEGGLTYSYNSAIATPLGVVSITSSIIQSQVLIGDMFPAVYTKTVWDQIFYETGYQYQSNFLNGPIFESLILPFSNGKLTSFASGTQSFTFSAYADPFLLTMTVSTGGFPPFAGSEIVPVNHIIEDPAGFWNTSTFTYTNVVPEVFNQFFNFDIAFQFTNGGILQLYAYRENDQFGNVDPTWASGKGAALNIFQTGNIYLFYPPGSYQPLFDGDPYEFVIPSLPLDGSANNYPINQNESCRFVLAADQNPLGSTVSFTKFVVSSQLVSGQAGILNIVPGQEFNLSQSLPANFKKKDFIMSIVRMFNLYIEPSKTKPNTLIIEPRDDYYASGSVLNWTTKLDLSQQIQSTFLSNTQDRVTLLSYTDDNDYYNEDFKNKTNQVYGQFKYITDNQFSQSEGKITTQFAPIPISEIFNFIGGFTYQTPFVLPKIGKYTNLVNNNEQFSRTAVKPRIALRGVLGFSQSSATGSFWLLQRDPVNFGLQPSIVQGLPSCWHFDNPFDPSIDLNFGYGTNLGVGPSIGLYYPLDIENWTNNNLYNLYYDNMLTQINDPNARMLTCELYLTPEDIQQFTFNNSIYMEIQGNGQYYLVNSIKGYDPTQIKTTTVELLKLNNIKQV